VKNGVGAIAIFVLVAIALWLALPKPPLLDGIPFSQCVRDRNGQLLRVTLTADQKFRIRTPLSQISPELIDATLRFEDKHFSQHPGVNPYALVRSAWSLVRQQSRTGGSTITMQLARLRFHLHTRSLTGKAIQIFRALQIERHYSKSDILEAYFNLAPYGRNIEGAGAASQIYFGKSAARLTRPEAVTLGIIPQSPSRRALFVGHENPAVDAAQRRWHDRNERPQTTSFPSRLFSARAQDAPVFLAPHFVQQVLQSRGSRGEIIATLDLDKQRLIERRVAGYVAAGRTRGIENAAVLLVDTRTMDVLAQVGSADFTNAAINGQVDGTRSARSPGSTLKPFVYALAMEQGLIHPLSVVADAPHSFGDYNPENFDRDFLGPIRASDALARSRNLPAVALAAELTHPALYEFLRDADVAFPQPESHYGLALPLGGSEITMENLVRLYAALANDGQLRPLRRVQTDPPNCKGRRILSPEAAFLTLEMIGNVARPEMHCADDPHAPPVFWKTGTSHGFRDAWTIGVFDHYVMAVWIGNFDGRPNGAFVGRAAAAPLFFQIVDSVRASWPEEPIAHLPLRGANLKRVSFCSVSGNIPGPHCRETVEGWFIPGVSPIKICDVHREVVIDVATGLRLGNDDGLHEVRREVYEFWPSELLALFQRAGLPRRSPPPFLDGVNQDHFVQSGKPPQIISPAAGQSFEIVRATSDAAIPLRAKTDGDVRELYWFANKVFLGRCRAAELLSWQSKPGQYALTAIDDHGRAVSATVVVR
jgi:penicillin-binding protein 1C